MSSWIKKNHKRNQTKRNTLENENTETVRFEKFKKVQITAFLLHCTRSKSWLGRSATISGEFWKGSVLPQENWGPEGLHSSTHSWAQQASSTTAARCNRSPMALEQYATGKSHWEWKQRISKDAHEAMKYPSLTWHIWHHLYSASMYTIFFSFPSLLHFLRPSQRWDLAPSVLTMKGDSGLTSAAPCSVPTGQWSSQEPCAGAGCRHWVSQGIAWDTASPSDAGSQEGKGLVWK